MPAATSFSRDALAFLRALKRNNRREWFKPRKEQYDALLQAPMIAIIERLATDLRTFAPDLVASPKTSLYRIYRDTRFSENKAPYKTHVAAVFPHRTLGKNQGAALYFHVSTDDVWIGGGMYSPDTPTLQKERDHIAANTRRLRAIVDSPSFKRVLGRLQGEKLQRVPRGFDPDHEAAEYLRFRQYLVVAERPASLATSPRFYGELVTVFKQAAPLVRFLNEPLAGRRR